MTASWLIAFWHLSSYNLYNKLVVRRYAWAASPEVFMMGK